MPKIDLEKADRKINIADYSLKEYIDYLCSFDQKILVINTDKRELRVSFKKESMPHLIGFQYAYDKEKNKNKFKGKNALTIMRSGDYTFKDFENNVIKNNIEINKKKINWNDDIKPRIEWLPYFLNTLNKKSRIVEVDKSSLPNNTLKGEYYYFKNNQGDYLILSLLSIKDTFTTETFIVNNGIRFLGGQEEEEIQHICWETSKTQT